MQVTCKHTCTAHPCEQVKKCVRKKLYNLLSGLEITLFFCSCDTIVCRVTPPFSLVYTALFVSLSATWHQGGRLVGFLGQSAMQFLQGSQLPSNGRIRPTESNASRRPLEVSLNVKIILVQAVRCL